MSYLSELRFSTGQSPAARHGQQGSTPRLVHIGYMVGKVAMRQIIFSKYFGFSLSVPFH